MKQHFQTIFLGLSILLILGCSAVSADTTTPETSEIEYHGYDVPSDPDGQRYHRFFPTPAPEKFFYDTRRKITANIDDTPEKETIVPIVVDGGGRLEPFAGYWAHAFLLILDETDAGAPKKKAFFQLYDAGIHHLEVPAAKTIEHHSPAFVFKKPWPDAAKGNGIGCKPIDLTGDGILDVWLELGRAVAVISFQNGEFKVVFSRYMYPRHQSPEYVDLDNDGIYEIKIPYSIYMVDLPSLRYLRWISLYEWDGNTYVLNNERFYAENDEFLIALLNQYNYLLVRYGRYEPYSFYLGLVFYYRGNAAMARRHLQWVIEHAEKRKYIQMDKAQDYIQAAEFLLKKLAKPRK
ncbi:hypothetical protein F4Z99_02985 [Candidatus Poribacteria bacterium]|nr:hypothetical protein [Candidatus Poribacteria bacterium]MYA99792.1 hypothetical protein [Candidatus Poribacteria bacterium]